MISPCISLCEMNRKSGYCKGCNRTIKEIMNWSKFTTAEREAIMRELAQRQLFIEPD